MTPQLLTTQEDTTATVWARLLRGHASARRRLSADLSREHGLSVTDYEALLLLSRADEARLRRIDLAGSLSLTQSGVTRLLDGLESAGLVEKGACPEDARVTYAVLTEAGLERLQRASESHLVGIRALFQERFTEPELATLAELLGRLPGAAGGDSCCAPS